MKNILQIITFFSLVFFSKMSNAQVNSPIHFDNPLSGVAIPSGHNMGCDYQGNMFGANWQGVIVSDYIDNGWLQPSIYLSDYYSTIPPQPLVYPNAQDPDVVIVGNDALVVYYYLDVPTNNYIYMVEDYSGVGYSSLGLATSIPIYKFPVSSGTAPFINIDANANGDIGIVFTATPTSLGFLGGSLTSIFSSAPSIVITDPTGCIQPDIAISDAPLGQFFITYVDNTHTTLNLNLNGSPYYSFTSANHYSEPRIACPDAGGSATWAVSVENTTTHDIELHYDNGGIMPPINLTNGSFAGLLSIANNSRPVIAFNPSGDVCNTLSVNWFNQSNGIIGVEIDNVSFPGAFLTCRNWYSNNKFLGWSLGASVETASAVCGRYADVKYAGDINGGHINWHTLDCIGAWRKKNLVTNPTNVANKFSIYPNPANDAVTLKVDAEAVSNQTIVVVENLLGQKVWQTKYNASLSNQPINISQLPTGLYHLKVIDDNQLLYVTKLVKE